LSEKTGIAEYKTSSIAQLAENKLLSLDLQVGAVNYGRLKKTIELSSRVYFELKI